MTKGLSSLVEDSEKAEEAHKMAKKGLESIQKLTNKIDAKFTTKDELMNIELEKLKKSLESNITTKDKK